VAFTEYDAFLEIDTVHMAEMNLDVRRVPELHADGHGDVGRIQAGGRDLIQQRLKEVMVATIDEDDPKALVVGEGLRRIQAREARADDDRDPGLGHSTDTEDQKIRRTVTFDLLNS
jgi:hypothetical protein